MVSGIRTYASSDKGRNLLSERVGIFSLASRTRITGYATYTDIIDMFNFITLYKSVISTAHKDEGIKQIYQLSLQKII